MKKRIAYILTTAALTCAAFLVGSYQNKPSGITDGYINVYDIKGWEAWDNDDEVGLEIEGYEITKPPYTLDTTVQYVE
jgi:hypothetical protein